MHFMMKSGPPENPIDKHITSEHITQNLKLDEKAMDHNNDERKRKFWLTIILAIISVVVLAFVVVMFRDEPEILIPILTLMFGGGLGFGGGYGFGKSKRAE